jgi:hypothetical protein
VALDSAIGYTVGTLSAPAPVVRSDSAIGYTVGTMKPPHLPILVRTETGWRGTNAIIRPAAGWPPDPLPPFPDAFFPDTAYPA